MRISDWSSDVCSSDLMAEEWGLAGGIVLLAAFAYVLGWGWKLAVTSEGRFERLLAGGLTASIFYYICINLMMVMGLAPVVGIPLPLISYGGSAMMTVMLCLGVLLGIDRANRRTAAYRHILGGLLGGPEGRGGRARQIG